MFERIDNWEEIVPVLELECIRFCYGEKVEVRDINGEIYFENAIEMLGKLCTECTYNEEYESSLFFFRFPALHEFYTLCREHARLTHVNFKKDIYVTEAEDYFLDRIRSINSYAYGWNIWIPRKIVKKKAYTLLVELGCEFYNYTELIEIMYDVKEYYTERVEELKKEIERLKKPRVIKRKVKKAA